MKVSKAFRWFLTHSAELKPYAGKHVAIVDDGIAAVADTAEKAYTRLWPFSAIARDGKKWPKSSCTNFILLGFNSPSSNSPSGMAMTASCSWYLT